MNVYKIAGIILMVIGIIGFYSAYTKEIDRRESIISNLAVQLKSCTVDNAEYMSENYKMKVDSFNNKNWNGLTQTIYDCQHRGLTYKQDTPQIAFCYNSTIFDDITINGDHANIYLVENATVNPGHEIQNLTIGDNKTISAYIIPYGDLNAS